MTVFVVFGLVLLVVLIAVFAAVLHALSGEDQDPPGKGD